MKILVIREQFYVDGHGEPESGEINKYIVEDPLYLKLNPDKYYDGDEFQDIDVIWEGGEDEEDLDGSEDGYNMTTYQYSAREISDEEAIQIQTIIDNYNKI